MAFAKFFPVWRRPPPRFERRLDFFFLSFERTQFWEKVGKAKETCEKLKKIDKTVFTIYMYADTPTCLMNDTLCKIYNLVDCPTWDY